MNSCWYNYTKSLEMEKALTPGRLDADPSSPNTVKEFNHWLKTFTYFLAVLPQDGLDRLSVLTNFVSPHVYDYIIDCETYEDAIQVLKSLYVKPQNEVYARHMLLTRKQNAGETLEEYLQVLKTLSKDCNFKPVDASTYSNEVIRDVFIAGLQSDYVSRRLLENRTLDLCGMIEQAKLLDTTDIDVKSPALLSEENFEENSPAESEEFKVNNSHNHSSCSNGMIGNFENNSTNKRRKTGNIRDGRLKIQAKNIQTASTNIRRKSANIRDSRLNIDVKNIQCNKLLVNKPFLRRVRRLESASFKQSTKQVWRQRQSIKKSSMQHLMRRRSHRMRKPPERLDW